MRAFWLFNHPAPYKIALFSCLAKHIDLTVFIERDQEGERSDAFYDEVAKDAKIIVGHPLKLGAFNSYSREPVNYLKAHPNFDLIIINGWSTFTEQKTIDYCKKKHIPYVFVINGGIIKEKEGRFPYALKKKYISGATHYLCPDERSKQYLIHYGADESKIALYPYGSFWKKERLLEPISKSAKDKLRAKFNLEGKRNYVSTGFFIKRKNFESLLELWRYMGPEDHLYLVGEGSLRSSYARFIEENKLTRVHLLPYMKHAELFQFYHACDAFLFPTHEDIYGHVVPEALSQGLPVFSSPNANASWHFIKNGENGAIVDFSNPQSVVETLRNFKYDSCAMFCSDSVKYNCYEESAKAFIALFEQFLRG